MCESEAVTHLWCDRPKIVRSMPLGQEQRRQLEVEMERSVVRSLRRTERLVVSSNKQTAHGGPTVWASFVTLIITLRGADGRKIFGKPRQLADDDFALGSGELGPGLGEGATGKAGHGDPPMAEFACLRGVISENARRECADRRGRAGCSEGDESAVHSEINGSNWQGVWASMRDVPCMRRRMPT